MTTAIFEKAETFTTWDTYFYPPIALRLYDRAIPLMLEMLNVGPGDLVLDAGCGVGGHSIRAAKAGCRVYATDISAVALTWARRRAGEAEAQHAITFIQGDLARLGFQDKSFSAIFSWGVIIHIPEVEKALDEFVRLLKPGGRLALYVTNSTAWDGFFRTVAATLLRRPRRVRKPYPLGVGTWYDMHGEQLWIWQMHVKALIAYLEARGLRCIRRSAGEFTQLHVHLKAGTIRNLLSRVNNAWLKLKLPVSPAAMNLLIFERPCTTGASVQATVPLR